VIGHPNRAVQRILLAAALTGLALGVSGAQPSGAMRADLEHGGLAEFSRIGTANGSLGRAAGEAYDGHWFAKASYDGGGRNGYARGIFDVSWPEGTNVLYGAAFHLPDGFKAATQGQVALMRWDNWPSHPFDADHGGVVINGSDGRARLIRESLGGDGSQDVLIGPFDLPEGRWFMLEVRQRLTFSGRSISAVYLDGKPIGTSGRPTMYAGRAIERIRYGLVAIAAGAQTRPLSLAFDSAYYDAVHRPSRLVRGRAVPAPRAPRAVRRVLLAANRHLPSRLRSSETAAIIHILRTARLLRFGNRRPRLGRWGVAGPGRYITVYVRGCHAFMTVDHLRLHAVRGRSGWRSLRWTTRPDAPRGYSTRHPPAL
jgi:hypothetical protein